MIRLRLMLPPFGAARTRARAMPVPTANRCQHCGKREKHMAQVYDDKNYVLWREKAMPYFHAAKPATLLTGPLQLSMVIVMPFLKSDRRKTFVPRKWHIVKPDADNIVKAILDCAERARWFANDSQVCRLVVEQVRAAQGEQEGCHITIKALDPYQR